jgi:hypothetical protein
MAASSRKNSFRIREPANRRCRSRSSSRPPGKTANVRIGSADEPRTRARRAVGLQSSSFDGQRINSRSQLIVTGNAQERGGVFSHIYIERIESVNQAN